MLNRTPYVLARNRSGAWEARWTERSGARSVTRTWSTGERQEPEARVAAEAFFRTRSVVVGTQRDATIEECVEGYLQSAETARRVSPAQRWSLKPVVELLGSIPAKSLAPEDLHDYASKRRVQPGTLRRELGALVAALNWSAKTKVLAKVDLPYVELPPASQAREVWLSKDEELDLWTRALGDTPPGKPLTRITRYVTISMATAARAEAVLDLTWERVDLVSGRIDFRLPGRALSNKRRAVVPIAKRLQPVLEQALKEAQAHARTIRAPWVPDRTPVCGFGSIRKSWETFIGKTPYSRINPHDLRRTWATLAAQRGTSLFDIAGVLGDSVATVTRHYAHYQPDFLRDAIDG